MLPARDRVGQIRRYTSYLNELFSTMCRACGCQSAVWESPLTTDIARAGISYTVLDDYHFRAAGWSEDDLHGLFVTTKTTVAYCVFSLAVRNCVTSFRLPLPMKRLTTRAA